jgi:hypothetical protein
MQDNDTQVTLIMSKELDRVRIRYQIQYTSSSGSEKKFKSSTATLNLADASNVVQVNKSYVTANSKGPVDTYFTILCFDVKYGTSTVKDVQIYRKKNTEFCRVPVSNSLYSYDSEDSCVRLGPLGDSHTDDYCALVEDCFTRVNNFSFQFRLPEASPTTPGLPTAADVVETSLTPAIEAGCGDINDPKGGTFIVNGTEYNDVVNLVCNDGFQLSGSPTATCLADGQWSNYGRCIKTDLKRYGVQPEFTISSEDLGIKSPLLIRNRYTAHIKFRYELTNRNGRMRIQNKIRCFKDLVGKKRTQTLSGLTVLNITTLSGDGCIQLPVSNISRTCRTYRVVTRADVKHGYVTVSDIQFGDSSICSEDTQLKKTLECSFADSDCGITNDACGIVDWEIRSNEDSSRRRRRQSTECFAPQGVPLLKKKLRSSCSFENLNIIDLQPSGFSVDDEDYIDTTELAEASLRKRRSFGYSIYLDPAQIKNRVAIGVLNLPEVYHHTSNAFLSFAYDMVQNGLHDLLVTAVCTSSPSQYLVPLDDFNSHYHKTHFHGLGDSGTICLDIHSYVKETDCSTFVIQMQGAAVETVLVVDSVYFTENLVSTTCGTVSNSRK